MQILCASLNRAVKSRLIQVNPIARYDRAEQQKPAKVVLDKGYSYGPQWEAILSCADEDTSPILICLYETGMRPAEVFQMEWDWIESLSDTAWLINIPPSQEKTGAIRSVPVSPKLLEVLKGLSQVSKYVFPSPVTGENRKGIRRAFRGILKRASLQNTDITPYALRRTRITIWDAIDGECCRHVVGHTANDVHGKHYREFTPERLFKLVGIEFNQRDLFQVITNVC